MASFIDYFTPAAIAAYWEEAYSNRQPYLCSAFFNTQQKAGLDLSWIKGSKGLSVSLMPSAFDSKAKFRAHGQFIIQETEMPFFREGYLIKEKDRQQLLRMTDINDPYVRDAVMRFFDGVSDLIEGARIVPERMIWQLMAPQNGTPGISISANGVDYTYNYDPEGTWKSANYTEITTEADKWSTAATADPIGDLQEVQEKANTRNGTALMTAIMSNTTFNYLLKSEKIKGAVLAQNATANIFMTQAVVRNIMSMLLGLNIIIYSKRYKDDTETEAPFYPDGYVTLLPNERLGTVWKGTTPEQADLMGSAQADVSIVDSGTAISRIITPHPVNVETYVSEIVLPSFERMDDVYVIKVA